MPVFLLQRFLLPLSWQYKYQKVAVEKLSSPWIEKDVFCFKLNSSKFGLQMAVRFVSRPYWFTWLIHFDTFGVQSLIIDTRIRSNNSRNTLPSIMVILFYYFVTILVYCIVRIQIWFYTFCPGSIIQTFDGWYVHPCPYTLVRTHCTCDAWKSTYGDFEILGS